MSNFLLLPIKPMCIFFLAIFVFIGAAEALELGISPSFGDFEGNEGEKLCNEFKVYSSKLPIAIKVSSGFDKKEISLPDREFLLKQNGNIEICLSGKEGDYKGAVVFKDEDEKLSIEIKSEAKIRRKARGVTALAVEESGPEEQSREIKLLFFMSSGLLLTLLALMSRLNSPRKRVY